MARKRRGSERVEPIFDIRAIARDGRLPFGLSDKDRSAPTRRRAPAKQPTSRKPPSRTTTRRTSRRRFSPFAALGRMIRRLVYWSVVVGIIMAGGVTALVGYYWAKLPPTSEWAVPRRPANVRILADDGALITNRADTTGASLRLEEMPAYLPEAVVAIEDRRFYWHFGIDPVGLTRAMVENFRSGAVTQGGSTLSQQLAKNLFLKPERTFERKIQEVILAVWLEASLTKREILELYLNRVYMGAGAYGVDAAAHRYFGKSARDVSLAEAATLAGLLKAPSRYSPIADREAAEGRAQLVLAAMRETGAITDRDASLAMSEPIDPVRDVAGGSGRYVADWVMDALPSFVGAVDQDILVETSIDMRLQAAAASALSATLNEEGAKLGASQGAFVAIDPSGAVKALVGGRDYSISPFNRAVTARRQPGSAFKPFIYLTALEAGLSPETLRVDQPVSIRGWTPKNYTRKYLGPVTLTTALALSLNTVSAQLTSEVGAKAVAATARRLGIKSPLHATPSIALGTSEVTLLELTGAFVPFSNGGAGVMPHVIKRIVTVHGKILYDRDGSGPGRVVHPAYVAMMNMMLQETLARGTGRKAAIAGWPAAGKTGTSQDFRDAWFVGYTGALTAGVWFGNDDGRPTKKASGSNLAAVAWHRFMTEALDGVPVASLPGAYRFPDTVAAAGDGIGELATQTGGPTEDFGPAPSAATEAAAILGDPDWQEGAPLPPSAVGGATPAEPPKKKSFFKRLFSRD